MIVTGDLDLLVCIPSGASRSSRPLPSATPTRGMADLVIDTSCRTADHVPVLVAINGSRNAKMSQIKPLQANES
jgi:hypothetical protein